MTRKYNIDLLRIASAVAVIIIHLASVLPSTAQGAVDPGMLSALNCIHNLMNWSVPVFFMITGYCVLGKKECTYRYCFAHARKFILVLLTVGFFFALLEEIAVKGTVDLSVFLCSVRNVISGDLWDHMWYVYAIAGVYLVLPVLHSFMGSGKSNIMILTGLMFAFGIVFPWAAQWIEIGITIPFDGVLFYVCLGGAIAKCEFSKKARLCVILPGLISVVWIIIHPNASFDYRSLPVSLMAAAVFMVFDKVNVKPAKSILTVSQCTWGIYLIHPFFINVAAKLLKMDFISHMAYLKIPVFFTALCLVSFAVTYILRKIPFVKKLF